MSRKWWKEAVVYQCYWRSFFDSNGDGIGDIRGLISKLDYIKELGADVLWLNPCYTSPDKDNGYDIADYQAIMPKAGSMDDIDTLIAEVHARGMRIIMDLVVNHTSDQHEWFKQSRSSKDNPKRDWYIWQDGKNGAVPNNYKAYFAPSAWEYDAATQQYYFHSFAIEQPDLNWKSKELRQAVYGMMKFWLDKGVDGFRMDVINMLAKPAGFPDADNPEVLSYMSNNPGLHDSLREMHDEVLSKYDCMSVGECPWTSPEQGVLIAGFERAELNTLFHFEVTQEMPLVDWTEFRRVQRRWADAFHGMAWNSQYLSNHDVPRQVSKYADDGQYRIESAKLLATLIHTLPGMPYIYQGEEIGMTNVRFDSIDDYDDIWMKHQYADVMAQLDRLPRAQALELLSKYARVEELAIHADLKAAAFELLRRSARDNARTPMQWDDSANAGFTAGVPWLKLNPNYPEINVACDRASTQSIYNYYRELIKLRKQYPALIYGDYVEVSDDGDLYAYERSVGNMTIRVILNLGANTLALPDGYAEYELQLANYEVSDLKSLPPYGALVLLAC